MLVNQAREQARKLNEPSPSTLKLGSSARKQAREQARAYSFKTEPSRACLILGSTRLGYTPTNFDPRSSYFYLFQVLDPISELLVCSVLDSHLCHKIY